jgi:Lon protease-like protein
MFPLAAVVFPTMGLPLHVFEQRYQCLTRDVLAGTGEFGICLISRGCEVGGGDQRVDVGTKVRVELATPLDDERWILLTKGVERVRVVEWLADDPYPRALVEPMPPVGGAATVDLVTSAFRALKALRRLQSEFADGWDGPCVDLQLDASEPTAPWALCAMSPLSLSDHQGLLEVLDDHSRLSLLRELCDAKRKDLEDVLRLSAQG